MKNIKRNILKAVISMACVLPVTKGHAQDKNSINEEYILGAGVSYVIPTQLIPRGVGIYVNNGFAADFQILDTNFGACTEIVAGANAYRFFGDKNTYKYGGDIAIKVGAKYDCVALMGIKNFGLLVEPGKGVKFADGHGIGINVTVGEYIKLYADFVVFGNTLQSATRPDEDMKKYMSRIGIIYVSLRKSR